jgi:hypothetical protein
VLLPPLSQLHVRPTTADDQTEDRGLHRQLFPAKSCLQTRSECAYIQSVISSLELAGLARRFERMFVYNLLLHLDCSKDDGRYMPVHGRGASLPNSP